MILLAVHLNEQLARPIFSGLTGVVSFVFIPAAVLIAIGVVPVLFKKFSLRRQQRTHGNVDTVPHAHGSMEGDLVHDSETANVADPSDRIARGHIPVRGRVCGSAGISIAHATVTLISHSGQQAATSATDSDGRYSLHVPSHTGYLLVVASSARQPQALSVTVATSPVHLDVSLVGTSQLFGQVRAAHGGQPIAGATVSLLDEYGQLVATSESGFDGGYDFDSLAAARYTLAVAADAYRPSAATIIAPYTGETRHDMELVGAITLHGVARARETGRSVVDALVTLVDERGAVAAVARTSVDGAYCFENLSEGGYTVIVRGYPPVTTTLTLNGGAASSCDVDLDYAEGAAL